MNVAEIRKVAADMRRLMPHACGDWADRIDAALVVDNDNYPRRHHLIVENDKRRYGPWEIYYDSTPVALIQWLFSHKDYDGAEDANDERCGMGTSLNDCLDQIDEMERAKGNAQVKA